MSKKRRGNPYKFNQNYVITTPEGEEFQVKAPSKWDALLAWGREHGRSTEGVQIKRVFKVNPGRNSRENRALNHDLDKALADD